MSMASVLFDLAKFLCHLAKALDHPFEAMASFFGAVRNLLDRLTWLAFLPSLPRCFHLGKLKAHGIEAGSSKMESWCFILYRRNELLPFFSHGDKKATNCC